MEVHEIDKDLQSIRETLNLLRSEGRISPAYLFGSCASGTAHARSDIDIAVYINSRNEKEGIDIIDRILMSSERQIEILRLDDEDEGPFAVQEAMRGIPLIDNDANVYYEVAHRALHESELIRYRRGGYGNS